MRQFQRNVNNVLLMMIELRGEGVEEGRGEREEGRLEIGEEIQRWEGGVEMWRVREGRGERVS